MKALLTISLYKYFLVFGERPCIKSVVSDVGEGVGLYFQRPVKVLDMDQGWYLISTPGGFAHK